MIKNYNSYDHQELPFVIGRACSGIVEGVGRNSKSGLEIGDEVWLASPWYEAGVTSQLGKFFDYFPNNSCNICSSFH